MSWSFWCSRCKKDHPGECPPAAPEGRNAMFPAVGSIWTRQMKRSPELPWETRYPTYKVVMLDTAESMKVGIVPNDGRDLNIYQVPVEAWDPDGAPTKKPGMRFRLIPLPA